MAANVRKLQASDPDWLKLAFSYEGLKEVPGKKHNPEILMFFADAGFPGVKDDETAWCAAFANAILARSGLPGTNSLAARSFLNWGKATESPRRGDLVVFSRGKSSWQGHVAFYLGETKTHVIVIGGNQRNEVNVSTYSKETVLGYRTRLKFNPVTGNVATSKQVGLITAGGGSGTASVVTEKLSDADASSALTDAGNTLITFSGASKFLAVAALILIMAGVTWMLAERFGWWRQKGF